MVLISLDDARNCTGFSDHSLLYADEVAELEADLAAKDEEIQRLRGLLVTLDGIIRQQGIVMPDGALNPLLHALLVDVRRELARAAPAASKGED